MVEDSVLEATRDVTGEEPPEVVRVTWDEALDRWGTDKPDLRFGMEIVRLEQAVAGSEFNAFKAPAVRALCVQGEGALGRGRLDALTDRAKKLGAAGLVWLRVVAGEQGTGVALESPVAKFLSAGEQSAIVKATEAEPGDLILLSGQLGAGKTVLVRGIATGMGIDPGLVRSPTFVLHHVYRAGPKVLHHLDLYRLGSGADIRLLDIDEMLASGGVVVVEWGEHASRERDSPASISIDIDADGARVISPPAGVSERLAGAWEQATRS